MRQNPFKTHPAVNTQNAAKRTQNTYAETNGIAIKTPTTLTIAKINATRNVNFLGAFSFIKFEFIG